MKEREGGQGSREEDREGKTRAQPTTPKPSQNQTEPIGTERPAAQGCVLAALQPPLILRALGGGQHGALQAAPEGAPRLLAAP